MRKTTCFTVLALWTALAGSAWAQTASAPVKIVSSNGVSFAQNVDREVSVDLGQSLSTPEQVRDGLFPEENETPAQRKDRERCERLIEEGFKCMPPARSYSRFNLPGVNFALGSSDLPELMKQQLRAFAEALRSRKGSTPMVRIDGHADATGDSQGNQSLSVRRAEAVRDFLVSQGVDKSLLAVEGFGASALRNKTDPAAAENRRVEIARFLPRIDS